MKFERAESQNPIDNGRVVGRPHARIDGPLKATGTATYAAEWHADFPDMLYGAIVPATIAKGRVTNMDLSAATAAPGVVAIVTADNAGPLGQAEDNTVPLLGGPGVVHYHQALAAVIAETFEQARAAAALVDIAYEIEQGAYDLDGARGDSSLTESWGGPGEQTLGDFRSAFADAPVQVDETFSTPDQSHAMIEPFASIARWDGGHLSLWTANQMIAWSVAALAETLKIPAGNVRLISPYIGGGFGAKLFVRADALLAALGAKATGRPVKVVMPRPMIFNNTTHRPATIQRVRIGAGDDGRIAAFGHDAWSGNQPGGSPDPAVMASRSVYAGPNRLMRTYLSHLDLPEGHAMRAPGDATGSFAVEIAMDELAEKLGMDPVALRIANDTRVDPMKPDVPFSLRRMVECLEEGARRFGWDARQAPGTRQEGNRLIGMGVAVAYRGSPVGTSNARVRLEKGRLTVETDMTDIGTGSYTIIAQTAAEMLGLSVDQVTVRLGDSAFPVSAGSGGQWGANSATSGVYAACVKLRETIAGRLGLDPDRAEFVDGEVRSGNRVCALDEALADGPVVVEGGIEFADMDATSAKATFGAHFVEVAVDRFTAEVRIRRMLAVCSAGRILNPVSARSQIIGAMTMGVGAALSEKLVIDQRHGCFINHDLAGYEVPVHADIPRQEVVFLDDVDPLSSPMKAHGVGELGLCGVAGAIANAVYNATGVRLRATPLAIEDLLAQMPDPVE